MAGRQKSVGEIYMAKGGFAITPSDTADLPQIAYGLNVQTAGLAKVIFAEDDGPVTIQLIQGWNPCVVKKVFSTTTTASGITGLK